MEKQLSFFCQNSAEEKIKTLGESKTKSKARSGELNVLNIFVDGAARGNPGPSGAGIFVTDGNLPLIQKGIYLGQKTNNQAEYLALLLALYYVSSYCSLNKTQIPKLCIFSDSELLVKQIKGVYSVKNEILLILSQVVKSFLKDIPHSITHVLREKNKNADKLANQGVDRKTRIPTDFLKFVSNYNPLICTLL